MRPKTQYTKSGDVNVAYQVFGEGQFDLVFVYGFVSHLDFQWTDPAFTSLLRRLASFSRRNGWEARTGSETIDRWILGSTCR
jgi:hypothetical protein